MTTLALTGIWLGLAVTGFIIICVLLILTILIQRPQGGGLSGAFGSGAGSGQTAFGAKTGDALTIFTIAVFMFYIMAAVGLNYVVKPVPPVVAPTPGASSAPGTAPTPTPAPTTPPAGKPATPPAPGAATIPAPTPTTPAPSTPGAPAPTPAPTTPQPNPAPAPAPAPAPSTPPPGDQPKPATPPTTP